MKDSPKMRLYSSECFHAAIQALRDSGWWKTGEQKLLAERIGYTPTHLSHVFKGKREAGAAMQEKIALDLDMKVEDFLKIGRNILEGRGFFPFIGKIEHLPANSVEQACEIVNLTNKQFGLEGALSGYQPAGWLDFLEGKKTPGEFYESYSEELTRLRNIILSKSGIKFEPVSPTPIEGKKTDP